MNLSSMSFVEIATAITAICAAVGALGGVIMWALATKFTTKALLFVIRDKIIREIEEAREKSETATFAWRARMEDRVRVACETANESSRRQDLAKEPFVNVVRVLEEMKAQLKNMADRGEQREDRIIDAITSIDKRVAILEHENGHKGSRG